MGHPVSSNGDFITLALVVKTQGRRGEVAVELQSDVPERFAAGMRLLALAKTPPEMQDLRRELQVEDLWPHKGMLVLKFAGVDSISDAETLVGAELQVPRGQRAELETGWTYISDLVGCVVLDQGREVGRIEDVQFGAGEAPLLIVSSAAGKKFDVPFAEAYLEALDVARRQVRMNLPEGMLEINAPVTADETLEQRSQRRKKP
jgi:16S rRNA processing protein RimM